MNNIGIIGNGFVGGAVAHGFSKKNPLIHDVNPEESHNTFDEVATCKHLFVCLPTPMVSEFGGEANTTIVEKCLQRLSKNQEQVIILKSTVSLVLHITVLERQKNILKWQKNYL